MTYFHILPLDYYKEWLPKCLNFSYLTDSLPSRVRLGLNYDKGHWGLEFVVYWLYGLGRLAWDNLHGWSWTIVSWLIGKLQSVASFHSFSIPVNLTTLNYLATLN